MKSYSNNIYKLYMKYVLLEIELSGDGTKTSFEKITNIQYDNFVTLGKNLILSFKHWVDIKPRKSLMKTK